MSVVSRNGASSRRRRSSALQTCPRSQSPDWERTCSRQLCCQTPIYPRNYSGVSVTAADLFCATELLGTIAFPIRRLGTRRRPGGRRVHTQILPYINQNNSRLTFRCTPVIFRSPLMKIELDTECAWCKSEGPPSPKDTSHGICMDCLKAEFPDFWEEIEEKLDLEKIPSR